MTEESEVKSAAPVPQPYCKEQRFGFGFAVVYSFFLCVFCYTLLEERVESNWKETLRQA